MYKAFVRSHFDYCDFIYHIPPIIKTAPFELSLNFLMESIEKIQYMGALAVTGAWQGTNRAKLYEELGWENLSDRRNIRRVIQLYKIANNMTPTYLIDKLPPRRRVSLYSRNETLFFRELRCHSQRYSNSFFPDAVSSWNKLIDHFTTMPSLGSFKSHIISLVRPMAKSIYSIHDPIGLRYLFRLRLNLSPLRSHKYHHNFMDTNSEFCLCNNGTEDTEHFLLYCPYYAIEREYMLRHANNVLQNYNYLVLVSLTSFTSTVIIY